MLEEGGGLGRDKTDYVDHLLCLHLEGYVCLHEDTHGS